MMVPYTLARDEVGHIPPPTSIRPSTPSLPSIAPVPSSPTPPSIQIPVPSIQSRQWPGETWHHFFQRESARYQLRLARESQGERWRRQSRELAACSLRCPGSRGPVVYEWTDLDGFPTRTRVARSQVPVVWEFYSPHQRRFNSFENEWDLCSDFDLYVQEEEEQEQEEKGGGNDDAHPNLRLHSPLDFPSYPALSPPPPSFSPPAVANRTLNNSVASAGTPELDSRWSWDGVRCYQDGFDHPVPSPSGILQPTFGDPCSDVAAINAHNANTEFYCTI